MTTSVSGERQRLTFAELEASLRPCSDNQDDPAQITPDLWSGEVLYRELRAATKARGSRKVLSAPNLPSESDFYFAKVRANAKRSAGRHATIERKALIAQERMAQAYLAKLKPSKLPKREHNGYMRVAVYLCALAWKVMNDHCLAGIEQPSPAELEHALRVYIDRNLSKFVQERDDPTAARPPFHRFRYVETEQADRLAQSLATSLLRDWTPDWIKERQLRGGIGGRHSKRGPSKATAANLAALAALPEGMTHAQRADALGVSLGTERRLWGQLCERPQEPSQEPVETTGAPEWWGGWEDAKRPDIMPAQPRWRRPIYPGERL